MENNVETVSTATLAPHDTPITNCDAEDVTKQILKPDNKVAAKASEHGLDTQARGKVTTAGMSQWINIFRVVMLFYIICFHQSSANDYEKAIPAHVFAPHVFTTHGSACNYVFYMLAQYFSFAHFRKLQDLNMREFTVQYVKQYARRYVQLRAAFLVLALGYESLLYWIFGEQARSVTINAMGGGRFWKHVLVPYYDKDRYADGFLQDVVGGSAWFVLELVNQESVFYIFYYAQHMLWRACKNEYAWAACYVVTLSVVVLPCVAFRKMAAHIVYGYSGNLLFLLRSMLVRPRPQAFFTKLYAKKHATRVRAALCALFYYAWLVANRHPRTRWFSSAFMFAPLALDLYPQARLWAPMDFVLREVNRIQMELYLLHSPFLEYHMPRGMPQIVPQDLEYLTPITLSWFVAWQLPLLYIQLSYPLWLLTKPIVEFVDWADGLITKKQKVHWPKLVAGLASVAAITVLATLQQTGVFGAGEVPPSQIAQYKFQWA